MTATQRAPTISMRIKKLLESREIELSRAHDIACERTNERKAHVAAWPQVAWTCGAKLAQTIQHGHIHTRYGPVLIPTLYMHDHETQSHNAPIPTRSVAVTEMV
jgi:hypothetical protein